MALKLEELLFHISGFPRKIKRNSVNTSWLRSVSPVRMMI